MAASIKCKPLWLGLALLGVLVVAATLGLYQLGVGQESDEPQGGRCHALPTTATLSAAGPARSGLRRS